MKSFKLSSISILTLCVASLVLTACKDDEEPVKPKLSFTQSSGTVSEDLGVIEVEVTLSKAAPEDLIVEYELTGSAYDAVRADINEVAADFEVIEGEYGEIEIAKGETTGIITLQLYSDFYLEGTETIEIKLQDANSSKIEITRDDEIVIDLEQEDNGLLVILEWPGPSEETPGIADMDMFLWIGETANSVEDIVAGSFNESYEPGEFVFIPSSIQDYFYGLSFNYYKGNLSPLNFTVSFVEYEDGEEVSTTEFEGIYTEVNENLWDEQVDEYYSTIIAQTFENDNGTFTNISDITTPESGSRLSNARKLIPANLHMKK